VQQHLQALSATTGSFSSTLGVTGAATFSSTVAGAFNGTLGATTPTAISWVDQMTLSAAGALTVTGAATFSGNVVGLTFESSVSSSSTNLATNSGGSLTLKNTSVTDGNFSNIGGYNSNTLVTSQINFVNVSQASRTGAITFNVHNGASMPEVGRFDASGNLGVGAAATAGVVNANSTRVTIAGTNAASNGGEFIAGGAAAQISMASGTSKSYLWGSGAYPMSFGTNSTERMVLDASGNLGLGVVPSAWGTASGVRGLEVGANLAASQDTNSVYFSANAYNSATGWKYRNTQYASNLRMGTNDGVFQFQQAASGTAGDAITWATSMTLDANGNLGLGVVPSAWGGTQKSLQLPGNSVFAGGNDVGTIVGNNVYWDGSAYKYIATAAANMLQFSAGSYLFRQALSGTAGNPITFTTAMTLDASGDVGIGLTNGNHRLQVLNDKANFAVTKFTSTSAATTEYGISLNLTNDPNDATRYFLYCAGGVTGRAIIYANGNIANTNNSYTAISDLKLKENIVDAGSQWDDIKALRVRKYSFKEENASEPTQIGVIAQEVEAAGMSGLVYETADQDTAEDGSFVDTGEVTKIMKYSILYMKAVKALQEAMERIESLETRIEALEGAK
jgi:hypothetical protein